MSNPSEVKCMRCGSTRHRTASTPNGMSGECLDCGATWTISRNTWGDDWKPGGVSSAQSLDDALRQAGRPASKRSAYDYFTYSRIVDQGEGGA